MDRMTSKREEVLSLADAVCNGLADDKALARLEELMIGDAAARQVYLRYLFTHDQLNSQIGDMLYGSLTAPAGPINSAGSRSSWLITGVMVTVMIAIALFLGQLFGVPRPRDTATRPTAQSIKRIGRVAQQWSAVWADPEKTLPTWSFVKAGQRLDLLSGRIVCNFDIGAELILQGPIECQVLGPKQIKVDSGSVTVRVSENARGFSVVTARGKIIDLGTEFGVSIDPEGTTDLVVFDGMVDVKYGGKLQRVNMGQAMRLAADGTVSRIEHVDYDRYSRSGTFFQQRGSGSLVIGGICDNLRDEGAGPYYQICHGGLNEDTRAYVDRVYEWNGIDERGMPEYLRGADYVLMFNDDKVRANYEVQLSLIQPADVYVFWDDRFPPPLWLTSRFSPMGDYIGMDEHPLELERHAASMIGVGAGKSVELPFSIWAVRVTDISIKLTLGAMELEDDVACNKPFVSMYGIAAVPVIRDP